MRDIPPRYNSKDFEQSIYSKWEKDKAFHSEPDIAKKPFTIVIPPPNVTGILHMGHALNNTIQDILIRWKKMQGFNSLWIPGTDHAGIATQNVVERSLRQQGIKRQDLGREKFIEEVWKWREKYGNTIISQLKRLGSSCDWDRTRFTMDAGLSEAVLEAFVELYNKGLIYRGNYIINWCPRCQTALSDEEAPHEELDGKLYHILYKFEGLQGDKVTKLQGVVVATTRPETLLGDAAVAVNPKDRRYKKFIGKKLILPIMEREIEIIADDFVDKKFGTGAVKVTPAHDPNDFDMARRHNLKPIKIMNPDGTMNENAGRFNKMDRFKAREAVLKELEEKGLLVKIEDHKHSAGHCYRCHTMIEPYLSLQWFVKMKPLAEPAIEAVKKGKIKFYPKRWTKVYLNWMENIRDWCISRQIWWGHRLPVYYCQNCVKQANEFIVDSLQSTDKTKTVNKGVIVAKVKPDKCPDCGGTDIVQDDDVLDTWFSSWLWPFSTLGWPESRRMTDDERQTNDDGRETNASIVNRPSSVGTDLAYFYPTSVLVTAPEILFFWVARMIMSGMEFMKEIPFKDVYIHGTVRDLTGKKMSKSLGNIIDPIEIIDEFGADALRFSIIAITSQGQDVFLGKEKFEIGRNFANKLWNASRFVLMNVSQSFALEKPETTPRLCSGQENQSIEKKLSIADKWILSKLHTTIGAVTKALGDYRFNEAESIIYDFLWHDFCDWYVEMVKPDITRDDGRGTTDEILLYVLENSLKLLHPFMPFVTEAIWQNIKERESIISSRWPSLDKHFIDKDIERKIELMKNIIVGIRNIRADMNIAHSMKIKACLVPLARPLTLEEIGYIKSLAGCEELIIDKDFVKPKACASAVMEEFNIFIPLEGIIDISAEKARLLKKQDALRSQIVFIEKKLADNNFISHAPRDVVGMEKERYQKLKEQIEALDRFIQDL